MKQKARFAVDITIEPNVDLSDGAWEALGLYYENAMGFEDFLDGDSLSAYFETSMDQHHYLEVKEYIDSLREGIKTLDAIGEVDLDLADLVD